MRVSARCGGLGMSKEPAYDRQAFAGRCGGGCESMPEVMYAPSLQPGGFKKPLPGILYIDEVIFIK